MIKNNLLNAFPSIAKDWDEQKNGSLSTKDILSSSKKKAWWKCENNHSYEVSVYSRVRSKGCKYCNQSLHIEKRRATKLKNSTSLAMKNPHLLAEWDYEKNSPLTPDSVSYGSHKRVWWKCNNGHEWEAMPQVRNRGHGCHTCSNALIGDRIRKASVKKSGSFADIHPLLLKEWDFKKNSLLPTEISPKSNCRANWICRYGHQWEATIDNRTGNGSNCPECNPQSSRLEIYLLCELRSVFEKVQWRRKFDGVECDVFIPEINVGIEVDGEYWHRNKLEKDKNKNSYFENLNITIIRVRDINLPTIEGIVIRYERTSSNQDITNNVLREIKTIFTNSSLVQYLNFGTQSQKEEYDQMMSRLPAPPDGNSIKDTHPEISKEWDYDKNFPLTPELFSKGSDQKFWWVCEYGHKWDAAIKNRTLRKSGCPTCFKSRASDLARKRRNKNTSTLEQFKPVYLDMYAQEKNRLTPSEIAIKSNILIWWKCSSNHYFQKRPVNMFKNHDCPICNSLSFRNPEITLEWNNERNNEQSPDDYHWSSSKKVWWKCSKGHEWETKIQYRTGKDKTGCPQCYNEKRSEIYRLKAVATNGSIKDANPDYLIEWDYEKNHDLTPEHFTLKSTFKVWWKCESGHSYEQSIASKHRGSICPICIKKIRSESVQLAKIINNGSLKDNDAEIAKYWHPNKNGVKQPEDYSVGSKKQAWWVCEYGHEWNTKINNMTVRRRKTICPICKNKKLTERK